MPTPEALLAQLADTALAYRPLALAWHLAILAALTLIGLRAWHPRLPVAAWLSIAPVASAAILATASGNLFNAAALGLVATALAAISGTLPDRPWTGAPHGWRAAGLTTVGFALAYPHFTPVAYWWDLAVTPAGVLPCPSLALTVGLALLGEGFGSRAWAWVAATAAALYGLFGVFRLGVWLDLGLIAAAVALAARTAALPAPGHGAPRAA